MSFDGDLYPDVASVVMTTKGDMVDFDTIRQRLAIGSANQILQVKSGLPSWETLSTAGSVLTTQGDVLVEGATGLERLGQSTDGYVLTTKGAGANPVWATVAGGLTFGKVVKTADETISSDNTLSDDADLSIAVNGSKAYGFLLLMTMATEAISDFKYAFSIPSGASGQHMNARIISAGFPQNAVNLTSKVEVAGTGGQVLMISFGRLLTDTTAGNFTLQWAQDTSNASNTTLYKGSTLVMWEEA